MRWKFWERRGQESIGNGMVASTDVGGMLRLLGAEGPSISIEQGLTIPPLWAAVHRISQTLAQLPLRVYMDEEPVEDHTSRLLEYSPCPGHTSFQLRENLWRDYLTEGRGFVYIEREGAYIKNLWPVRPSMVMVRRPKDEIEYVVTQDNGTQQVVPEQDMIDLPWSLMEDRLSHRSPIYTHRESLSRAIYLNEYAALNFAGGGLPPYIVQGPTAAPEALARMKVQIETAIKESIGSRRRILALPPGYEIQPISQSARDNQLVEQDRLIITKVAQIYMIPPVFLQDLSQGTFNNTEQQDLNYAKHTISPLAQKLEEELLLKLYGRVRRGNRKIRHDMDELLRGDYTVRTRGHALSIQTGQLTPNEARELEARPPMEGGDDLLVQTAMTPLERLLEEPDPEAGGLPGDDPTTDGDKQEGAGQSGEKGGESDPDD